MLISDNPRFLLTNHDYYFFIINTELTRSIDNMNIKNGIIVINHVLIEPQVTKITKKREFLGFIIKIKEILTTGS